MVPLLLLVALAEPSPAPAPSSSAPTAPASTPAAAAANKPRIFVLDFASNAVDKGALRALSGVLSAALQKYPELDVLSGEDVRRALEVDADRKLAGCKEDSSCIAEIAAGLGASLALSGDVEKLGGTLVVNLNLFDTDKVRSLGRTSLQVPTLDDVPNAVAKPLRNLLVPLYRERGWTMPVVDAASSSPSTTTSFLPIGVAAGGGAVAVAGGIASFVGFSQLLAHDDATAKLAALQTRASTDKAGALADAVAQQKIQTDAADAWNSWAAPTAFGGAALAVVGVGVLVGGIVWSVTE